MCVCVCMDVCMCERARALTLGVCYTDCSGGRRGGAGCVGRVEGGGGE